VQRLNVTVTEGGMVGVVWATHPKDASSYVILAKQGDEPRRAITGQIAFPKNQPLKMQFVVPMDRLWAGRSYVFQILAMRGPLHGHASPFSDPAIVVPPTAGRDPKGMAGHATDYNAAGANPPERPLAPTGTIEPDGHILLRWPVTARATGYMIRCIELSPEGVMQDARECTGQLGNTSFHGFQLPSTEVREGVNYRFQVVALNSLGESEPSKPGNIVEAVKVTAQARTAVPGIVDGIHAAYKGGGILELSWNALESAGSYQVLYREALQEANGAAGGAYHGPTYIGEAITRTGHASSEFVAMPDGDLTETRYTIDTLTPLHHYHFQVVAKNKFGSGPPSTATPSMLFGAETPDDPEPPEASSVAKKALTLSWAAGLNDGGLPVTSFKLQMRVMGTPYEGDGIPVGNVDSTPLDRLMPGTKYRFRLAAKNAVGWSPWGDESLTVATLDDGKRKAETWKVVLIVILGLALVGIICFWTTYAWNQTTGGEYVQLNTMVREPGDDVVMGGEAVNEDDGGIDGGDGRAWGGDDDEEFDMEDRYSDTGGARDSRAVSEAERPEFAPM